MSVPYYLDSYDIAYMKRELDPLRQYNNTYEILISHHLKKTGYPIPFTAAQPREPFDSDITESYDKLVEERLLDLKNWILEEFKHIKNPIVRIQKSSVRNQYCFERYDSDGNHIRIKHNIPYHIEIISQDD